MKFLENKTIDVQKKFFLEYERTYYSNEKIIVNLNDGWLYEGDVKKEKLKCRTYNLFQDFDFNFNFQWFFKIEKLENIIYNLEKKEKKFWDEISNEAIKFGRKKSVIIWGNDGAEKIYYKIHWESRKDKLFSYSNRNSYDKDRDGKCFKSEKFVQLINRANNLRKKIGKIQYIFRHVLEATINKKITKLYADNGTRYYYTKNDFFKDKHLIIADFNGRKYQWDGDILKKINVEQFNFTLPSFEK